MLKLHLVDLFSPLGQLTGRAIYFADVLLSICYTSKFPTNTVTNRTDGAYALVYGSTSVDRRRCDNQ